MNFLVKKNDQTFGPHSREEIVEFIESGELSEQDLASLDGEENWDTLGNLLSSELSDKDQSVFDQFEDDEVDYDKLKEWEDVFVDEDTEDVNSTEVDPQEEQESMPTETQSISVPPLESPPEDLESAPPPFVQDNIQQEEIYSHPQEPVVFPQAESSDEYIPPPPPASLPLPPPPESSRPAKKHKKEAPSRRSGRDRISSSHNIKGLNNKQTVIVVKGEGILAKLYSTSLLFIILFIIVCILGFAGLIFAPERVSPILQNIGVPSELIQSITSPPEDSK